MNKKIFPFIVIASFLGVFLRLYINDNFLISLLGSFFFGLVVAKRLSKSKNEILLTGFCSCFTSFSGFIFLLYELINQGNFLKTFFFINIFVILNLFVMHCGFTISRKFN